MLFSQAASLAALSSRPGCSWDEQIICPADPLANPAQNFNGTVTPWRGDRAPSCNAAPGYVPHCMPPPAPPAPPAPPSPPSPPLPGPPEGNVDGLRAQGGAKKRVLLVCLLIPKDYHFAKTGSGQTEQKLKTNVVIRRRYSQGSVSSAAGAPVRTSAAYLARCACGSTARQWSQTAPPPSTARRQETTAMWCRWRARRSRRVRIGSMWSASTRCATSGQSSRTRRSAPKVGRARRAEE